MQTTDVLGEQLAVGPASGPGISIENPWCVRYALDGRMIARQGTMIASRGEISIATRGQGMRRLLKRALTGEGVALMELEGRGDVWFADRAKSVFLLALCAGQEISLAGHAVLCADPTVDYDIRRVKGAGMSGGGLFNCAFGGDGALAIATDGQPIVIGVGGDEPVRVDTDAVVGWSSALTTTIHRSESMKSLLRGGSGEAFALQLEGDGFVIVQPSEEPPPAKAAKGLVDAAAEMLAD